MGTTIETYVQLINKIKSDVPEPLVTPKKNEEKVYLDPKVFFESIILNCSDVEVEDINLLFGKPEKSENEENSISKKISFGVSWNRILSMALGPTKPKHNFGNFVKKFTRKISRTCRFRTCIGAFLAHLAYSKVGTTADSELNNYILEEYCTLIKEGSITKDLVLENKFHKSFPYSLPKHKENDHEVIEISDEETGKSAKEHNEEDLAGLKEKKDQLLSKKTRLETEIEKCKSMIKTNEQKVDAISNDMQEVKNALELQEKFEGLVKNSECPSVALSEILKLLRKYKQLLTETKPNCIGTELKIQEAADYTQESSDENLHDSSRESSDEVRLVIHEKCSEDDSE